MNPAEGGYEVGRQLAVVRAQRGPPRHDHIVIAGPCRQRRHFGERCAKPAPDPVPLHGAAGLSRDRHAEPRLVRRSLAPPCLQRQKSRVNPAAGGSSQEIRPPGEAPDHGGGHPRSPARPAAERGIRPTGACGHARAVPQSPCVHPPLPCGRGSHAGACARACSADRSVSPSRLRMWSSASASPAYGRRNARGRAGASSGRL